MAPGYRWQLDLHCEYGSHIWIFARELLYMTILFLKYAPHDLLDVGQSKLYAVSSLSEF